MNNLIKSIVNEIGELVYFKLDKESYSLKPIVNSSQCLDELIKITDYLYEKNIKFTINDYSIFIKFS